LSGGPSAAENALEQTVRAAQFHERLRGRPGRLEFVNRSADLLIYLGCDHQERGYNGHQYHHDREPDDQARPPTTDVRLPKLIQCDSQGVLAIDRARFELVELIIVLDSGKSSPLW
jgi:hypothetical protein